MKRTGEKKYINVRNRYTYTYVLCSLISLTVLLIVILYSHGNLISNYFWHDEADTGMDFFHSIEYVNGRAPYDKFNTLYPPLANLFYYIIFYFIPVKISSNWPMDNQLSVMMRRTDNDLRVYQAPMIIFLCFMIACILFIVILISDILDENHVNGKNWLVVCFVFSYGMLNAIERGNILLLSLPLTIFYVFYHDSEKKIVREMSYVALAISAGLKLYPAFFGILLIKKKDWKAAIRTIIYGSMMIVLPMFFFNEGIGGLSTWVGIVFDFSKKENILPWVGNGFSNVLYNIKHLLGFFNIDISTDLFTVVSILVVMLLLISSLVFEKKWKSILAITLAMVFFQSQGDYIFSFFLIPILMFMIEEKEKNYLPYIGMLVLILPLPIFYKYNQSYPRNSLVHITYIFLFIWCIFNAYPELRKKKLV